MNMDTTIAMLRVNMMIGARRAVPLLSIPLKLFIIQHSSNLLYFNPKRKERIP